MISRRNIRVKVMQTLYTVHSLDEAKGTRPADPQKILQQHFDQTRSLLVYLLHFITEVARYAETDAHQRASKHLPTADDLNVNVKIAGNQWLWKVLEDPSFKDQLKKEKPDALLDRMEVIELHGYTDSEKFEIAKRHLIPKQLEKAAIKPSQLRITDAALKYIASRA